MNLSTALEIVAKTNPGMVRSHNEDAVLANPVLGLVVLADGMGGYNAGEIASGMATALLGSELEKCFTTKQADADEGGRPWVHVALAAEVARANTSIYQAAQSQPQYAGMGTTLVTALFHNNKVSVAHIGDSRMYRLRGEDFQPITRDHSLLQEQIDSGLITKEQARHSQNKNLVTRALGVDPTVEAELHDHDVLPGDVYLLCSDGLNDMVEDDEIGMTLGMLSANLELCAEQLVQMANDNGGRDNVSVIVIKVKTEFAAERETWLTRFLSWFK
jgi:serine/threonine protein phosphatase PrpC